MSANIPEILVAQGPLKGRRFTVEATGLRLGRSSTCEISIPDPSLSRNHCLFEVRDGQLWVTDLASANGTLVNGEPLGADSKTLQPGDRVVVFCKSGLIKQMDRYFSKKSGLHLF